MNERTPDALRAEGEDLLKRLEADFDSFLQAGELGMAESIRFRHDGAAFMLQVLGLISRKDYETRTWSLFVQYMDALFPDTPPKEAVCL